MLNLIQHLIKSKTYETLKRVQGDNKKGLYEKGAVLFSMSTK